MASYSYADLEKDEIRLIRLLPGNFNDNICFVIEHAPLVPKKPQSRSQSQAHSKLELGEPLPDGWKVFMNPEGRYFFWSGVGSIEEGQESQQIEYEALSYVWGLPDDLACVSIYRHDAGSSATPDEYPPVAMKVRRNLVNALRHLRFVDRPRSLWVDAVCIDQNNIPERNQQVPRMGMIYRQASRVIAWLGMKTPDSSQALAALKYLASLVEMSDDKWIFRSTTNDLVDWRPWLDRLPFDDEIWAKLDAIFSRPYFERLWTVQEVRLASPHSFIQCGDDTITLSEFQRATLALFNAKHIPPSLRPLIYQGYFLAGSYATLVQLLGVSRIRHCSDIRDKIYGLLSIAPPQLSARIKPDYTLPPEEVCKDFCLSHIDLTKRLDILTFCESDDFGKRDAHLPSWVLNLSVQSSSVFGFNDMQAASTSRSEHSYLQPDQLSVTGVLHSRVVATSGPIPTDMVQAVELLSKNRPHGLPNGTYSNGENLLDAWIGFLTLGCLGDKYPESTHYPFLQDFKKSWVDVDEGRTLVETCIALPRVLESMYGAALIELDNGYLGLGPSAARPGDCAVVLLGCPAPMILRSQTNEKFIIVGKSHIHGLTNGEALVGKLSRPWIVQSYRAGYHYVFKYYNNDTSTLTDEDPRLPPLNEDWRKIHRERTLDDPLHIAYFKHIPTGHIINSDPRLLPDALRSRGIQLQTFELV
ncbi:HET domain containing protein [Hyaloscypha variabilis]